MRKKCSLDRRTWCGPEGEKKGRNILWSVETKIHFFGNDAKRNVRRPKGKEFDPKYTYKTVKHGGGSLMVWGCFSWYGVGPFHRIDGIMDRFVYKDILETVMLPYAEDDMPLLWKFQQDKHASRVVKDWFREQNVDVLEWPSQSPDLNPIENLWGELKREVRKTLCQNKCQLWDIVQRAWYNIPIGTCRKLYPPCQDEWRKSCKIMVDIPAISCQILSLI